MAVAAGPPRPAAALASLRPPALTGTSAAHSSGSWRRSVERWPSPARRAQLGLHLIGGAAGALAGAAASRKRASRRPAEIGGAHPTARAAKKKEEGLVAQDAGGLVASAGTPASRKSFAKGFDRNLLRDRRGKVIAGGGGKPEPPGAQKFFDWLEEKGCRGLINVQLIDGGGVALRADIRKEFLPKGEPAFFIHADSWLGIAEGEEFGTTRSLVWRFLTERWAGESSDYAPFVEWLGKKDMSLHPIAWDATEVEWLKASHEAYHLVTNLRAEAEEGVQWLLQRCSGDGASLVPSDLLGDPEALAAELKWAYALVEAHGIILEELEGLAKYLIPLITDTRNSATVKGPNVMVQAADETSLGFFALKKIKPGRELLQNLEPASSAKMLAQFGIVPGSDLPGVPPAEILRLANSHEDSWVWIPEAESGAGANRALQTRVLAEFGGLDITSPRVSTLPVERATIPLSEAFGTGRMLPLCRYLALDVRGSQEALELVNRWFVGFFQQCNLEVYPEVVATEEEKKSGEIQLPYMEEVELVARQIGIDFFCADLEPRLKAMIAISEATNLPMPSPHQLDPSAEDAAGMAPAELKPGQVVSASFKAKKKDGSVGRSKTQRQAIVVSIQDAGTVKVEFLSNKKRHEIPADWIESSQPAADDMLLPGGLSGWRLFQPFHGGACFIVLQACGWTSLAFVGAAVLHLVLRAAHVPGFTSTLGVAQLIAQVALVCSLAHFENVHVPLENWRQQAKKWSREGIPVSVASVIAFTVVVAATGITLVAPPSRQALGWTLLVVSLLAQAAGLRMMWTLTWNLGAICAYLLESQEALAVMACMGIGSINSPWYIGRTVFYKVDFPTRAMIGLSQWATDELFPPRFGLRGHYMHDVAMGWIRVAFAQLDTALHILPGSILLQHCARDIRAIHAVYSVLLTALWGCTLSLRYVVLDWQLLWKEGKLCWKRWGSSSLYEPPKVAHIYQFQNSLVPQDSAFTKCCPGFLTIISLGHLFTMLVAASPWAGEIFFAAGFGHQVSQTTLAIGIACCLPGGAVAGTIGLAKVLIHKAKVDAERRER